MPTAASKKRELERIQLPNGAAPVIRNKRTRNCAAVDPGSEQDPEDEEEEEVEEVEEESKDHTTSEEDEDMVGQNVPKSAIDVLHGARRIDGLLAMFGARASSSCRTTAAGLDNANWAMPTGSLTVVMADSSAAKASRSSAGR